MIEEKLTHAHLKKFQQQTTTTATTTRQEDDHQTSFKSKNPTRIQFNANTRTPTPLPPPSSPPTKRRTTTTTITNNLLNLLSYYSYNEENKSFRNRLESHTHHNTTTTTNARHLKHNQGVEKEKRQELQALQGNHYRQQEAVFTCFNATTTSCTKNLNVYKHNNNNNSNNNTSVMSTTTRTTSSTTMTSNSSSSSSSSNIQCSWLSSSLVGGLLRPRPRPRLPPSSSPSTTSASASLCFTLLILTTTCSLCSAGSLCESQSWWDPYKDKCIPCTVCQGDMIPLRPCQMHRDTVCGSIYDLKIDWVVLSKTEPNWKERRKFDGLDYGLDHHQLTAEQLQQLQDETDPMDWQTAALFLAVLACLLFFIVAACILVHHMRQWRRMERRLDQDVEELSTKLMAKLAEVQSLEGGTFFIGNADALRIPTTTTMTTAAATFHQPQHVMLPEKSDKNHHHHHQQNLQHDRRLFNTNLTTLKSGNVYIEENSSKC